VAASEELARQLRLQAQIGNWLRARRRERGALELETIEARPVSDGQQITGLELVRKNAARDLIDWSPLKSRAEIAFFQRHFGPGEENAAADLLADFDIILILRERSRFSEALIAKLPKLKMLSCTGSRAPNVDLEAATKRGIVCTLTSGGHSPAPAAEMSLALLLAAARKIPQGDAAIRAGRFQEGIAPGINLEHRTLGIVGLGRIGAYMARYGHALGMRVIAWSQNLTAEKASRRCRAGDKGAAVSGIRCGDDPPGAWPRSRGLIGAAISPHEEGRDLHQHVARADRR
jgi:hypothetical protein